MTKKDYERIASAFKAELQNLESLLGFKIQRKGKLSSFNEGQIQQLRSDIQRMSYVLKQGDPRFDKFKFLEACGISGMVCEHGYQQCRICKPPKYKELATD